jgi:hypothetical protein
MYRIVDTRTGKESRDYTRYEAQLRLNALSHRTLGHKDLICTDTGRLASWIAPSDPSIWEGK